MKAVAMMTPDPKYLAPKKTHDGTSFESLRFAKVGKMAPGCYEYKSALSRSRTNYRLPKRDPAMMTKMAEMRTPIRPSYEF